VPRQGRSSIQYLAILKVLLGPILLIQGRKTKQTALRLPEAEGQRHGSVSKQGCDEVLRLLFVGDSTMAGVGVTDQVTALASQTASKVSDLLSRSVRWHLIAKSGLKTGQILELMRQEEFFQADVLITAVGSNDVFAQTEPSRFIDAYKSLVDGILPKVGPRLAIISGLPPLHITPAVPQPLRWFFGRYAGLLDRYLCEWIRPQPNISYISLQWAADPSKLAQDRFHPGEVLYREWSYRIAEQIVHAYGVGFAGLS
jgi:lysophospholipase L1-like esterase